MFEDEREDLEIQKAISKMKRLDKVLALRISNEKRVKRRSEELHHTLWQELQVRQHGARAAPGQHQGSTRAALGMH